MTKLTNLYKIYKKHPNVITDSRKIEQDCLFVALKGPNFNGNQYAKQALEKGAAYVIIDEEKYNLGSQYLLVKDSLATLQALALHHRQQFEIPVLAITGSNGKTTTKELLNAIFKSHYRTHCTKGNFNNHIGVPLTLLEMPLGTEVAIIEMGANHIKEIDFLCRIAEPTHGLITNIGKAHLEGFGSLEGVKQAKSELYKYLANKGMIFVNKDELYLEELSSENKKKLFYQETTALDDSMIYEVALLNTDPFVKAAFKNEDQETLEVDSHLMGYYNFNNIMTAISVGRYFKVPNEKIKVAVEGYKPENNRSQIVKRGSNTFLMDAYNANPDSMRKALIHFASMPAKNRVAILGDMLELGEFSETEHRDIVDLALSKPLGNICLVGEAFWNTQQVSEKIQRFKDVEALKSWYKNEPQTETLFLLKGSRGIRLEALLK